MAHVRGGDSPRLGLDEAEVTLTENALFIQIGNLMNHGIIHPSAIVETQQIGQGTRIWAFTHVMKGVLIGANCNVGSHCFIESGVVIGSNVTIKNGNMIWDGITLGDGVSLALMSPSRMIYIPGPHASLRRRIGIAPVDGFCLHS